MDHSEIIARVGGKQLQSWFPGVTSRTLVNWRARGIPYRFWAPIIEKTAADPAICVTLADLENLGKREVPAATGAAAGAL